MKILILSYHTSDSFSSRANAVYMSYLDMGHNCTLVYSLFDHHSKGNKKYENDDWIPIKTLKYRKNFSIMRIFSYIDFALKATMKILSLKPHLTYIIIPPNILAVFSAMVSKILGAYVVLDIVDMWPETLPVSPSKKKLLMVPLMLWSQLRTIAIKHSDYIVFECNLFRSHISKKQLNGKLTKTIYLTTVLSNPKLEMKKTQDTLNFGFIGSINHITDFDLIINLLKLIRKDREIFFHIIGDGDRKDWLLKKLEGEMIKHHYHGLIFDNTEKSAVLSNCQFGFNCYNEEAFVGLSYKSLDYFSNSVAIINTAKHDTWDLVDQYKIGFNCRRTEVEELSHLIGSLTNDEIDILRANSKGMIDEFFEFKKIRNQFQSIIKELSKDETAECDDAGG